MLSGRERRSRCQKGFMEEIMLVILEPGLSVNRREVENGNLVLSDEQMIGMGRCSKEKKLWHRYQIVWCLKGIANHFIQIGMSGI